MQSLVKNERINVTACPHPFKAEHITVAFPEGMTVYEILIAVQPEKILRQYAHIFVNNYYIKSEEWNRMIPNKGDVVVIRIVPGKGGGKNPLRTLATVAVIAASFAVPALLPATISGKALLGSLTVGGLIKGVVGGVGLLAVNALIPPSRIDSPSLPTLTGTTERNSPTLFIEGARNTARRYGTVPVCLGVHRNVPPLGVKTFTELIGNDQHLRMVVIWGYGRLKVDDIKIGDTAITDFDDVTIQTREGIPGEPDTTLFPKQVDQDDFSILLKSGVWHTKTTSTSTDEIIIDIIFPRGLVRFDDKGNRAFHVVGIKVNYRLLGSGVWLAMPTPTSSAFPSSWIVGEDVTMRNGVTSAFRGGLRWTVPTRGQYEVRVQRSSVDTNNTRIFDEVHWASIKSILNEDPLNFPYPLARTAIRIKASGQLNNIIDNINATTSSYVLDWNGSSWANTVTSNPASLFRHVLQGNANEGALVDARLDLSSLQDWHDYCDTNNFEFNMIRDFQSSVYDTITEICIAGRASPVQIDDKWGVIIDELQTTPVQHFTPRNSWGFEAEKAFIDMPHGLRIRFANKNKNYESDEMIVYDDGYTEANATIIEGLDVVGVTDPDHVWKHGRFNLAGMRLRPERWRLNADFEHIIARRGNMVLVTHDVLLVGVAGYAGRIKSIQTNGGGDATGITVDEEFIMQAGNSYGVSIRTVADAEVTKEIVLNVGAQTVLVFDSVIPTPHGLTVGDLLGYGILGSETIEGLVLDIEEHGELTAMLTIIPNSPAIHAADTGAIPPFNTQISDITLIPNVGVTNVRTDESVLRLDAGNTLIPRIAVAFTPIVNHFNATIEVQIRPSSTSVEFPYQPAIVVLMTGNEVMLEGVEQTNTYDVRLRWRDDTGLFIKISEQWTEINNINVIGQTSAPGALTNLSIQSFGSIAFLNWDEPDELDVKFGGTVKFRHSHELDSSTATWGNSVSIGTTSKSSDMIATLPLKPGTYLAKVFDKGGRGSTVAKISTKHATVLTYADVDEVIEETAFGGTHSNTIGIDNVLKLVGATTIDTWGLIDDVVSWDAEGGIVSTGTYTFGTNIDLGTVKKVRATSDINVIVSNVLDLIDARTENIDLWESIDGTDAASADCRVQIRVTDDDPAGAPTWSDYNNLESAEFENRGLGFRAILTSNDSAYNISVSKLRVKVEEVI